MIPQKTRHHLAQVASRVRSSGSSPLLGFGPEAVYGEEPGPAPSLGSEEEPAWDRALAILGIAQPVAKDPQPNQPQTRIRPRYRSRFFFKLDSDIVEVQKAAVAPPKVDYADQAVEDHLKRIRKILPKDLSVNIDVVREFFVDELSPLTLALSTGSDQARAVLKGATGSEVDPEAFYRFEQMAHQAVLIRLSMFLETYLGLPEGTAHDLLPGRPQGHRAQPPSSPQSDSEEGPGEGRRDLKGLHRKLQRLLDTKQEGLSSNVSAISPIEG